MIDDLLDMIIDYPGQTIATATLMLLFTYGGIRHCRDLIILDQQEKPHPTWYEPANQESRKHATYSEWTEYLNKTKDAYCGTSEQSRADKEAALRMCIYEEYLMK